MNFKKISHAPLYYIATSDSDSLTHISALLLSNHVLPIAYITGIRSSKTSSEIRVFSLMYPKVFHVLIPFQLHIVWKNKFRFQQKSMNLDPLIFITLNCCHTLPRVLLPFSLIFILYFLYTYIDISGPHLVFTTIQKQTQSYLFSHVS